MILTREFGFAKHLPWQNLDALFAPYPGARWPHLNRLIVQHFNEKKESIKRYKEGRLEDIILPMTPILSAADLLRFTVWRIFMVLEVVTITLSYYPCVIACLVPEWYLGFFASPFVRVDLTFMVHRAITSIYILQPIALIGLFSSHPLNTVEIKM